MLVDIIPTVLADDIIIFLNGYAALPIDPAWVRRPASEAWHSLLISPLGILISPRTTDEHLKSLQNESA